jgi:hypothetical protein
LFAVVLLFVSSVAFGQFDLSRPISFQTDLSTSVPTYTTPEVNVRELLMEDSLQAAEGFRPNRVGQSFLTNITPNNTGTWETIGNIKVWRVRLSSANAYSLKVTLSNFELPQNTRLFAYNEDGTFLMGPFTSDYNVESRVLPIPLISGETIIIECVYNMEESMEIPVFSISRVSHIYTNILKNNPNHDEINPDEKFGNLLECHHDINCPEGAKFQTEKRAVARIIFDDDEVDLEGNNIVSSCTGTLINTTTSSSTPFFLTANHCIDSETEAASVSVYFNFEREICGSGNGSINHVICGARITATRPNPASDFTLLELNARVPSSYQPFFAGWSRNITPRDNVVTIHHPKGHEKKITIGDNRISQNFNEILDPNGDVINGVGTVWVVDYTIGTTEKGSSGSALFDAPRSINREPRIIGTLSSGGEGCFITDNFARFDISWSGGTTKETRLRDWLDIAGTNPVEMQGYFPAGWRYTKIGNNSIQGSWAKEINNGLKTIAVGDGNQVFYRGKDDDVQTIYLSSTTNNFQHGYLNASGRDVKGDIVVGDGNQVFYVGKDNNINPLTSNHLWTYFYMNGSWNNAQLSSGSAQKVSDQCGALVVGNGNQVFYRGTDNKIHIYYWDNGTWCHGYLGGSNAPSSEDAGGDVIVDKNNNNQVIYRGADGKVHAYTFSNGSWIHSILDNTAQVNTDCGSLTIDGNGNIFYKGVNDDMVVLIPNGSGGFTKQVLGGPTISNVSNIVASPSSSNVMYRRNGDGKMRVWYGTASGFGNDWIETSWQAPSFT